MGTNNTGRKSLDKLAQDPRVVEIWTERDGCFSDNGESYWLTLAEGWRWDDCGTLHEGSIRDLKAALSRTYRVAFCPVHRVQVRYRGDLDAYWCAGPLGCGALLKDQVVKEES